MTDKNLSKSDNTGLGFVFLGILAVSICMLFGIAGAFKYLYPEQLSALEFYKMRPLHVSLSVSWIFLAAIGGIYHYLPNFCGLQLFSTRATKVHFWVFLLTGLAIIGSYFQGEFGGREYWAYPPIYSIPIFATWILFGLNFILTVRRQTGPWPVYYWMWGTGILFFLITYTEAHLWLIPFFQDNIVRELTVQWKAYGALVGSWNMLVYGTALFVMEKIGGDAGIAHSKKAFGLFFLSFVALLFGWAHHVYPVGNSEWIRNLAYIVSMTELYILFKIIWDWRGTLSTYNKCKHMQAYRFIFAADIWVLINLILAIFISIPSANLLTHGTHITVAHAMGTTIGINSMILLGSVFFIIEEKIGSNLEGLSRSSVRYGYWLTNLSLSVFLGSLFMAGIKEGFLEWDSFYDKAEAVEPQLLVFACSGIFLLIGLWMVLLPALGHLGKILFSKNA